MKKGYDVFTIGLCSGRQHSRSLVSVALALGLASWSLPAPAAVNVLTWHNDAAHTGQNLQETQLSLANVNTNTFGALFSYPVDGFVYAQPLVLTGVAVPGRGTRNLVYVATEHDSVYAFDADDPTKDGGAPVWWMSFVDPRNGITSVPTSDLGVSEPAELGITGTPAIDPVSGTLYVVTHTKEVSVSGTTYPQRLHALDVATGAEKFGGPMVITASTPGKGANADGSGHVRFDTTYDFQRTGLLLLNGVVYVAFASAGDIGPYHGWVLGFDAQTLQLTQVYNDTPNGDDGGIWMSGASPAADPAGNLYLMTGNGDFNAASSDFGDSFIKLAPSGTNLVVADYFAPYNQAILGSSDGDLGSGAPMLLPDAAGSTAHPHLLVGCGKWADIYLIDRDNMGHFNLTDDSQIVQSLPVLKGGTWGNPAYFNGLIYYQGSSDYLRAFSISNAQMSSAPVMQNSQSIWGYPNGTPSVSANGTNDAIVWILQTDTFYQNAPAILHAYNATNLEQEIYNSSLAGTRDLPGLAQKFAVPVIANGKVYVQGGFALTVYANLQAPQITSQPASQAVLPGSNLTLSASASGPPPLSYQWQLGASPIPGATNSTLVLTNITLDQSGAYSLIVSNSYGATPTAPAGVLVAVPPLLSIDSDQQLLLTGSPGVPHQIQFSDQIGTSQTWQPLLEITLPNDGSSDQAQASFQDPGSPGTFRFYRAVVFPPAAVTSQ